MSLFDEEFSESPADAEFVLRSTDGIRDSVSVSSTGTVVQSEPRTIAEIQQLLAQDLETKGNNYLDNSVVNENSFYSLEEETENSVFQTSAVKHTYLRPSRQKKVVLHDIQNTKYNDATNTTKLGKRKKVMKKPAERNPIQDENDDVMDNVAKEINDQFKKIDEFQLVVE